MEKRWWIYGPLGKGKILLEQKETFVHLYSSSSGECGQRLSDFHYIYFMDTVSILMHQKRRMDPLSEQVVVICPK